MTSVAHKVAPKSSTAAKAHHRIEALEVTGGFLQKMKLEFADGSWILLRLSGTEPLVRLYTEAGTLAAAKKLAEEAQEWIES